MGEGGKGKGSVRGDFQISTRAAQMGRVLFSEAGKTGTRLGEKRVKSSLRH